jgi:hypothetical protein
MSARIIPLGERLILFRYFNRLFGAETFRDLQDALRGQSPGYDAAGRSHFFHVLAGRSGTRIPGDVLARYDANLRDDVAAINVKRPHPIQLEYFQYLAALYTEIFLDRRANGLNAFIRDLNAFVTKINLDLPSGRYYSTFEPQDLQKVAYWMATGSGKTLLLHINYRQFLRYQPDPGDNVLLITPNEELSTQHLHELRLSGIPNRRFLDGDPPLAQPYELRVIEITKITAEKTRAGVSVDVEAFEGRNLLFVDEGHKGSGGDAWKRLRDALGADGFTFEYSATFGQAIYTARRQNLLNEYSKAIIFDYSYKYFHGDGYGKEYQVLNLRQDRADEQTDTLLTANLLAFYEQARLFHDRAAQLKPYNLEPPLWIFIGSSVNAVYTRNRQKQSDVLRVALFLDRVLRNENNQIVNAIADILAGRAELLDEHGRDLFARRFAYVRQLSPNAEEIYSDILRVFFHAQSPGGLRLCQIKGVDGEIGLKAGNAETYFGLINIGDVSAFFKLVQSETSLVREEDAFGTSLFETINRPGSTINVLIGSKKFIEGWSSWRVSTMGLLNIGRTEGTQIIQLFGRGVRLMGKDRSLKRSAALPGPHPMHLQTLETLNIFGVRANYMSQFRDYLEREGVSTGGYQEVDIPIRANDEFLQQGLLVPRLKREADFKTHYITLSLDFAPPRLDLRPQVTVLAGTENTAASGASVDAPRSIAPQVLDMLDWDRLYFDLLAFKNRRGWHNLFIPRQVARAVLDNHHYTLYAAESDVRPQNYAGLQRVQATALAILEKYCETYYHHERRRWESKQMEYRLLDQTDDNLNFGHYRLTIPVENHLLLTHIDQLLQDLDRLYNEENTHLPRVHFDRHIYLPLLSKLNDGISASPPGLEKSELKFVKSLRKWLQDNPQAVAGTDVFLLRNQSQGRGIGFFEDAGFYPDFILWTKREARQRITFIDPHGMRLDSGPESDKVQLYRHIKESEKRLGNPDVSLESFIISATDLTGLSNTPAWHGYKSRSDFAAVHILFEDSDLRPLFADAGG